jgi:hypothetical protein
MRRPETRAATFAAGDTGPWRIDRIVAITGEGLPHAERLAMLETLEPPAGARWSLRGVTGHLRYTERSEKTALDPVSPVLGRPEATCAALIPIRKSPAWWALTQDERRAIFEERSHHIAQSLPYLPRVARRLHHCRELDEAFDFLTWFEFAPEHAAAFDELLAALRASEEWAFVEHEVELRLSR